MTEQKISVRTNLYLWLLTGRSDDFANTALNTGIYYRVLDTPAEVVAARELLRLSLSASDFYVLGALASALMSTPLIRTLPNENDAVFQGSLLTLPTISVSESVIPPHSQSWPSFDGGRAGSDGFIQVTFSYVDGDVALIQTDAGGEEQTNYTLSPEEGGTYRLHFEKSAEYGVRADFSVSGWAGSDTVTVTLSPTRYPYRTTSHRIVLDTNAINLMSSEGTMQGYSESSNPARQVGMLAVAIMRRMIKQIHEDQAGFTVTTIEGDDLSHSYEIDPTWVEALNDTVGDQTQPVGFNV
tara:strand:- start:1858 stop:2748 length:891 start_codon:yes stop_codon:yes gene_type:complete